LLGTTLQCVSHPSFHAFERATFELTLLGLAEHHQAQPQQPAPDLPGQPVALADAIEVAQQMRLITITRLGTLSWVQFYQGNWHLSALRARETAACRTRDNV